MPLCPAGGAARSTAEHLVFRQRACLAREGFCQPRVPTSPLLAQAWPRGLSWHRLPCGAARGTSAVAGGVPASLECVCSIPRPPCHPAALPSPGKAGQGTTENAPELGPSQTGETRSPAQCWRALLGAEGALLCQEWGCRAQRSMEAGAPAPTNKAASRRSHPGSSAWGRGLRQGAAGVGDGCTPTGAGVEPNWHDSPTPPGSKEGKWCDRA